MRDSVLTGDKKPKATLIFLQLSKSTRLQFKIYYKIYKAAICTAEQVLHEIVLRLVFTDCRWLFFFQNET